MGDAHNFKQDSGVILLGSVVSDGDKSCRLELKTELGGWLFNICQVNSVYKCLVNVILCLGVSVTWVIEEQSW